jgi:hypothetical protein
MAELMGDAADANREVEKYLKVTREQIKEQANIVFRKENCSILNYNCKPKTK